MVLTTKQKQILKSIARNTPESSGIYVIQIKNYYYVGSTKNFSKRFRNHAYSLFKSNHHNTFLQNVFNKYGYEELSFIILAVLENDLKEAEYAYIQSYCDLYSNNVLNIIRSPTDNAIYVRKKNHYRRYGSLSQEDTVSRNLSETLALFDAGITAKRKIPIAELAKTLRVSKAVCIQILRNHRAKEYQMFYSRGFR